MRPPRSLKITCGQSFPSRFLLADCFGRCQRDSQELQRMPSFQFQATPASFCTQDHSPHLALCRLGTGHGGPFQDSPRRLDTPACRRGQVHQVDRSEADQEAERADCRDVHHRHHYSVRNGTNFAKGALARFCATQGIRLDLASVAHPQSNGQVERANGLILSGIKPRLVVPLERSAGCWLSSGVCVLPLTSQPASPLSSLCMVPRRSSQLTSSSTRLE